MFKELETLLDAATPERQVELWGTVAHGLTVRARGLYPEAQDAGEWTNEDIQGMRSINEAMHRLSRQMVSLMSAEGEPMPNASLLEVLGEFMEKPQDRQMLDRSIKDTVELYSSKANP